MVGVAHDYGWQPCGSFSASGMRLAIGAVNKWEVSVSSCRPTST